MNLRAWVLFLILFSAGLPGKSFAGVITGGGGGLVNPDPVDLIEVESFLQKESRQLLSMWLYRLEDTVPETRWTFLFKGERNIYDLMNQTGIEIRTGRPCLDSAGAERDASIYASRSGFICLSTNRILPSLNGFTMKPLLLALLAHEYAHLMGADENSAAALQNLAMDDLNGVDLDLQFRASDSYWSLLLNGPAAQNLSEFAAGRAPPDQLRMTVSQYTRNFESLIGPGAKLYLVRPQWLARAHAELARLNVAALSACKSCRQELDQLFGLEKEVTAYSLWQHLSEDSFCRELPEFCFRDPVFANTRIANPVDAEGAKRLARQFLDFTREMFKSVQPSMRDDVDVRIDNKGVSHEISK